MNRKAPKILEVKTPKGLGVPLIVDAPHSGTLLPEDFHFNCSLADLRQSDEFYVDRFGEKVTRHGGTFLRALISRAYIDLNRSVGDLHPSICSETIPWPLTRSKRVNYGIGLIRHLIRPNEPVYQTPLTLAEIEHRIRFYYEPYYDVLGQTMAQMRQDFGRVLHINLHAMPSIGADSKMMPDVVLGDHDGHSCARAYRDMTKKVFEQNGFKVVVNDPYKGVELTRRFAKPRQGFHSLQIEVNKALYMNEDTLAVTNDMAEMLRTFDDVWASLSGMLADADMAHAAE